MGVSHIVVKKGGYPILGGRGRFGEGRRCLKWGYILGRRVDSMSVAYGSLNGGRGYILGEGGGVDYGSVAYSGAEGGIFCRDG